MEALVAHMHELSRRTPQGDPGGPAGRVGELMAAGVGEGVAEAMCTCEVALMSASIDPEALGVSAAHAMLSLRAPGVLEGPLRVHSTGPDTALQWRAVGACIPRPWRSRCLELADVAETR